MGNESCMCFNTGIHRKLTDRPLPSPPAKQKTTTASFSRSLLTAALFSSSAFGLFRHSFSKHMPSYLTRLPTQFASTAERSCIPKNTGFRGASTLQPFDEPPLSILLLKPYTLRLNSSNQGLPQRNNYSANHLDPHHRSLVAGKPFSAIVHICKSI